MLSSMKITPIEIRQKTFEKKLRGYDKDEVAAFLLSLSQEWEQVQDEVKELRLRNEQADKEINQLREVENSLFKTLKTAEDTGANMIDQATKTAELHLRETQMNADALLNEAKSKARALIDEAEGKARLVLDGMEQDLQTLKMEYRSLENLRDIIVAELRNLSNDTLARVEKVEEKASKDAATIKTRLASSSTESANQTTSPVGEEANSGEVTATEEISTNAGIEEHDASTGNEADETAPDEALELESKKVELTKEEDSEEIEEQEVSSSDDKESSFFDKIG